jgi:hypothetical protein
MLFWPQPAGKVLDRRQSVDIRESFPVPLPHCRKVHRVLCKYRIKGMNEPFRRYRIESGLQWLNKRTISINAIDPQPKKCRDSDPKS